MSRGCGSPPHVAYLVSRFASEANRRLMRVLSLKSDELSPVVIQERHKCCLEGLENITLRGGIRPGHFLKLMGLRRLGNSLDGKIYFPSAAMQFARRASRTLSSRIEHDLRQGRRVTVVTFAPPHDVLETGYRLKRQFPRIRWVVVCQIVWALDAHYQHSATPGFIQRMAGFEGSRLRAADAIAVESDGVAAELARLYQIPLERLHAIPNAYDESDVSDAENLRAPASRDPHGPLTLGFLGNCFKPPKVPGEKLMEALASVVARGLPVRLRIVGDAYLDRNPDYIRPYPWIERHPRCGHREAVAALAGSTALLLVLARTPWTRVLMHAKLPYYLASGLPIIAIVPDDSNTAAIIRQTGSGVVIDSDSDWGSGLYTLLSNWNAERSRIRPQPHAIARYSWDLVSRDWIKCLSGGRNIPACNADAVPGGGHDLLHAVGTHAEVV
jgi:glycosyltransferase involved in cell wall biosynthesis